MMTTAEKASQNATTRARRSVHQTSFLWALVQALVRSTTQRWVAARGAGFPFGEIAATRGCYGLQRTLSTGRTCFHMSMVKATR